MWLHSALMPAPYSVPGSSPVEQPISTLSRWQRATRSHPILKDLLISNNLVTTAERERASERDCAAYWAQKPMSHSKSRLTANNSQKTDRWLLAYPKRPKCFQQLRPPEHSRQGQEPPQHQQMFTAFLFNSLERLSFMRLKFPIKEMSPYKPANSYALLTSFAF